MPSDADMSHRSIHWFRKGLRLHDNPALLAACTQCSELRPIFILDPWFVKNYRVGANRWRFLAQSLTDLDDNLKKINGRLYVVRGSPLDVFPRLFKQWRITRLTYEVDTEPYALDRDAKIDSLAKEHGVEVIKRISHTLYDSESVIAKNGGKPPMTYQRCQTVLSQMPAPAKPLDAPTIDTFTGIRFPEEDDAENFAPPTLEELNVKEGDLGPCLYPGGETEALARMNKNIKRTNWICTFEKPKTEPNSLQPSTTVLSPYLKFGCLSARMFYWKLLEVYKASKKHSQPPVSLHGQLLWREFFYIVGSGTEHFNRMAGNRVCRQIPWDDNAELLDAWRNARTGYPFIDAIMTQLRQEGWIHHLARHAVACFLTRGDLWVSWERGQEVFEEWLLDADWFLNAGNWMWLSASAFFHQYYRVYSPIAFGKKTDKNGDYIKKYLPQLKKYPPQYIYEPWRAPASVQQAAGCIIGTHYPKPIVDHDKARDANIGRMKAAYASGGGGDGGGAGGGDAKKKAEGKGQKRKDTKDKGSTKKSKKTVG